MERGFIKCGSDFYGAVGNCYAAVRIGSPVLIDEGEGAVAPHDRDGCEFVAADDAPAEVRRRLDPAYYGPEQRPRMCEECGTYPADGGRTCAGCDEYRNHTSVY